jgi:glycerate 2-kinase
MSVLERLPRTPVVVLAPDKFAGSLTAQAVAASMTRGLRRVWPEAEIRSRPMADGGEGTLDAILASAGDGGTRHVRTVSGAAGQPTRAAFGVLETPEGPTAIVEVAQIVGIGDAANLAVPVGARSSRGVGELLRGLVDDGVRRLFVALGGSSTSDGGAGMLEALGAVLLDAAGARVAPAPAALARVERVNVTALDRRIESCHVTLLSDVDVPLCGPRGATAVFGPRKGVEAHELAAFDDALAHFAERAESALGRQVMGGRGAGAAGGLGFALQALGATYASGAEVVADFVGLDEALRGADWLLTGEGRSDAQTLTGKAPLVAARRARTAGVPATLVSGALDPEVLPALSLEFAGCFAVPAGPIGVAAAMAEADALVADRVEQLARLWAAAFVRS